AQGGLSEVDDGITGRTLVALVDLLVMLPTMVIAWMEPGPTDDAGVDARPSSPRRPRFWAAALLVPAAAAAWLLVVSWAPVQAAGPSRSVFVDGSWPGSACRHFAAGRMVGTEFGATVGMRV